MVGFSIDAATYIVDGPYVTWYCNNGVCRVPDTATTEFALCLEGPEKKWQGCRRDIRGEVAIGCALGEVWTVWNEQ